MSSVLRALKKLEEETNAASGMPGRIGPKTGHGFSPVNPLRRLLPALLVLLILSGGIGVMLAGKAFFSPAASTSESGQARPASQGTLPRHSASYNVSSLMTAAPEMTDDDIAAWPEHVAPEGRDRSVDRQLSLDMTVPLESAPSAPDLAILSESRASGLDAASVPDSAPASVLDPVSQPDSFPGTASSGSSAAVESPAAPDFSTLDSSAGLTLQAISWSPDPSRRLAVINGRLCREGESVEGFAVVRINPDDVLLSDGRVSGKLVFNIR